MGKSTISMAIFNSFLYVYQGVISTYLTQSWTNSWNTSGYFCAYAMAWTSTCFKFSKPEAGQPSQEKTDLLSSLLFFGASHWTESFPFQHNPTQPGPGAESVCRSSPNGPALWGAHSLYFSRASSEIPRHFWWDYHELAVHFRWFLASAVLMCFFKHVKRPHTLVKTFYIGLREKTIEMQTNQRRTERTRHTKDNHK